MIFMASYFLLATILTLESLVLGYVLRGTVSVALDHEVRRSSPIGLRPKARDPSLPGDVGIDLRSG